MPARPDFGGGGNSIINQFNRPDQSTTINNWWDHRRPGDVNIGNRDINININNNFQNSINWSVNQRHWGSNPWWNRPAYHPWYGGSWNCGWNRPPYYRPPAFPGYWVPRSSIGWGLIGWGLGNLIFDCGYHHYHNPYIVKTVYVESAPSITYQVPITQIASPATVSNESSLPEFADEAESLISQSQAAFAEGNYILALEGCDNAIQKANDDGGFHEYRALILFALGQYEEAAGVLHPLLVSSPGWDWTTMIKLYGNSTTYADQLKRLESFTSANPDKAAPAFLLGYHYMVCGYLEEAAGAFARAAEIEPADRVARELASLASHSVNSSESTAASVTPDPTTSQTIEAQETNAQNDTSDSSLSPPTPFDFSNLLGRWQTQPEGGGTITLTLASDGTFTWDYAAPDDAEPFQMKGSFNLGTGNLLTLAGNESEDAQMAAIVSMPETTEMTFVLAGGPPGDPGLKFKKQI
ncbi:MAG: tetratricopeptide repeat protein [Verrucomicrobiales bacterium]|nr:tetratricopeptide repeat protein [Verrucomicrobiales bacterium]